MLAPSGRRVRRPASDASTMAAVAHIDLDMADTGGVARPEGFTFIVRKNGDVVIRHHGQVATTLRRARAAAFLADVANADDQELMARMTGNYKRGNERAASSHARNRPC